MMGVILYCMMSKLYVELSFSITWMFAWQRRLLSAKVPHYYWGFLAFHFHFVDYFYLSFVLNLCPQMWFAILIIHLFEL